MSTQDDDDQELLRSSERLAWISVVVLTMATVTQFWHGSTMAIAVTTFGLGLTVAAAIILRTKRKQD